MSPDTIATIISVSIVVLAIAIIVLVIVSKIRHLSRTLFGTSSLIEGIQGVKEDQEQMRETPRSLHGMTSDSYTTILSMSSVNIKSETSVGFLYFRISETKC